MSNKKFANADEFNRYLNDLLNNLRIIPPKQYTGYKYILAKCSDLNKTQMVDLVRRLSKMYGSNLQVSKEDNGSLRVNDLILNNSLDFLSAIHAKESKEMRKNDPDGKNEPTVISGGDGIEIIPIDSEEEAIEVGKRLKFPGTPWCITWKAGNLYMNYRTKANATFYFIINHNLPTNDDHHAVALRATDNGLLYTNFSNSNGDMGDGEELLEELGLNPADFPVKPLSEEEKVEHRAINNRINFRSFPSGTPLEKFKALENIEVNGKILPNVLNHYVQRHPVTDQQLQWLIDNGRRDVINDLVNNDYGMPDNQRALLSDEELKSYKRKKKIVVEALINTNIGNLEDHVNGDDEMEKYAGEYIMDNIDQVSSNPDCKPENIIKFIPEDKELEYVLKLKENRNFNANDVLDGIAENRQLEYFEIIKDHPTVSIEYFMHRMPDHALEIALSQKDKPYFNFKKIMSILDKRDYGQFLDEMKDHPDFDPNVVISLAATADVERLAKLYANHPNFDYVMALDAVSHWRIEEFANLMQNVPGFDIPATLRELPYDKRLDFAFSMKDHPKFDFGKVIMEVPQDERETFAKMMIDHPKFDFLQAVKSQSMSNRKYFALSLIHNPKFSFKIALNSLLDIDKKDFVLAMKDHPQFDFNYALWMLKRREDREKLIIEMKDHPAFDSETVSKIWPEFMEHMDLQSEPPVRQEPGIPEQK